MGYIVEKQKQKYLIKLPIEIDTDDEYLPTLRENFYQYGNWAKEFINSENGCMHLINSIEKQDMLKNVVNNSAMIINCVNAYYKGKVVLASSITHNLLKRIIKADSNEFVSGPLDKNYSTRMISFYPSLIDDSNKNLKSLKSMRESKLTFFRARTDYYSDYKEMYHIPLDRRDIVGTDRFSIPGIPCLYLGSSVYDTWLELGRPAYHNFNVSAVKLTEEGKDLRVLNLAANIYVILGLNEILWDEKKKEERLAVVKTLLELYPLVIATSIRNKRPAGKFRSDYIVSHLIMLNLKKLGLDGVAYLSKRIEEGREDLAYPQFVNYAFPAFDTSAINKRYGKICEKIRITKPRNYEEFLSTEIKASERYEKNSYYLNAFPRGCEGDITNSIIIAGETIDYHDTWFCKFENCICGQKYNDLD